MLYPSVEFDYVNLKMHCTVMGTGKEWSTVDFQVHDPKGYILGSTTVTATDKYKGIYKGSASIDFGLLGRNYGYDDADATKNNSGMRYTEPWSIWKLSNAFTPGAVKDAIVALETGTIPPLIAISQTTNIYSGVPVIMTRGDAVPHFRIGTVSGLRNITWDNTNFSTTYLSGRNYANCIGEILTGTYAGQRFFVESANSNGMAGVIDRDASNWSGALFKMMPYRTITTYSGWQDYTGQSGGINARFTFDKTRCHAVGSITTNILLSGHTTYDVGSIIGLGVVGVTVPVTVAYIADEPGYNKTVAPGDIVYYYQYNSPATLTGAIIVATGPGLTPGTTGIVYYPTGTPSVVSNGSIVYRANEYVVLAYPKFDSNYIAYCNVNSNTVGSNIVTTPSAELELSVNDHESTYNSVGERSHFHIGPVRLSNGQTLQPNYLLRMSGSLYQGDVSSDTPVATWINHGTMTTNIGLVADGKYQKRGVFTNTFSQALNASETLFLDATVSIGSAKISRTITIPVQPSA